MITQDYIGVIHCFYLQIITIKNPRSELLSYCFETLIPHPSVTAM